MSRLVEHLNREWAVNGWPTEDHSDPEPDIKDPRWEKISGHNMQAMMYRNLREILETFSKQGHSGTSANYAINMLEKLLRWEPISPLTGAHSEWEAHPGSDTLQNKRCSRVFKDRKTGRAYDSTGRVFRHPDGNCFTSRDSDVTITFPYVPTTEYVDVDDDGNVIKDAPAD